MRRITFFLLLSFFLLAISSCEKDEPETPNEEEVITTLQCTLTPQNGGQEIVFVFQDLDGDGGEEPTITSASLKSNTAYDGEILLLNESVDPTENITEEVLEEAEDHQFFFTTDIEGLKTEYNDTDMNGNPIGVAFKLTTEDKASGELTIILRHEPNKFGDQVEEGVINNAGGETDIEVTFPIDVE